MDTLPDNINMEKFNSYISCLTNTKQFTYIIDNRSIFARKQILLEIYSYLQLWNDFLCTPYCQVHQHQTFATKEKNDQPLWYQMFIILTETFVNIILCYDYLAEMSPCFKFYHMSSVSLVKKQPTYSTGIERCGNHVSLLTQKIKRIYT